jgi:hypothetical protein
MTHRGHVAFLRYQQNWVDRYHSRLGSGRGIGTMENVEPLGGGSTVHRKKIAVVALLCAVVALTACRREEYQPLKLGGPAAEQPAR